MTKALLPRPSSLPGSSRPPWAVYGDLNGESYRAREWGLASTRLAFPDTSELIHPADCLGDVGPRWEPCFLGFAAMSLADASPAAPPVLVLAGSETGERAAVVLGASAGLIRHVR